MLGIAALAAWAGCENDETVGPCYHLYKEPLINVTAATSSANGDAIPTVALTGFERDGTPITTADLIIGSYFVEPRGDTLLCHLPCGFGRIAGDYSFVAGAAGFQDKTLTLQAQYQIFQGGCPSFNDGGMDIVIELTPSR